MEYSSPIQSRLRLRIGPLNAWNIKKNSCHVICVFLYKPFLIEGHSHIGHFWQKINKHESYEHFENLLVEFYILAYDESFAHMTLLLTIFNRNDKHV